MNPRRLPLPLLPAEPHRGQRSGFLSRWWCQKDTTTAQPTTATIPVIMKSSHRKKNGLSYRAWARKTPHTISTAGMPVINTRFGDPLGPIVRDRNRRSRLRNVTGRPYPGTGVTVTAPRPHDARGARWAARAEGAGSPRPGAATTWSKHRQGVGRRGASFGTDAVRVPGWDRRFASANAARPGSTGSHLHERLSAGREHHVFGGAVAAILGSGGSFGAEAAGSAGVRQVDHVFPYRLGGGTGPEHLRLPCAAHRHCPAEWAPSRKPPSDVMDALCRGVHPKTGRIALEAS